LIVETGEVVMITDEIRREVEAIYAEGPLASGPDQEAFNAAIEERGYEEWEEQAIRAADLIESGFGERYIDIPKQESRDGYALMEEFIEKVHDPSFADRLWSAIQQSRPFDGSRTYS
jgi:hypothetical protein